MTDLNNSAGGRKERREGGTGGLIRLRAKNSKTENVVLE